MEKRAVISFDLDGTLFDALGRVHPEDMRLLSTEQPYWFVPATGRQLHSMRLALGKAGLFKDQKMPLPLVLQNGAAIYAPQEVLVRQHPLAAEAQEALIERLSRLNGVTVLLKSLDTIHPLKVTPFGERSIAHLYLKVQPGSADGKWPLFNKIMCLCEEKSRLDAVFEMAGDLPLERAFSKDSILEFTAEGVNKGSGLKELAAQLGLGSLPLLAAGDGGNDTAMLESADISFAPLDSPEEMRSRVDRVVDRAAGGLLDAMIAAL